MLLRKFLIFLLLWQMSLFGGVTGKVSGKIFDQSTGEPLIGANVMLLGSSLGSATDVNGVYHILNVPPGFYDLKVNMIGYGNKTVTGVRVEIDLTAVIDLDLTVEAIEGQMITVEANQKLVKVDVASSQKSISFPLITYISKRAFRISQRECLKRSKKARC